MLRRLIVIPFGFLVAVGVGMIFLPLASLFDATTREAGLALALGALFGDFADAYGPDEAAAALGFVVSAVGIGVCAAPLAVVTLIGEAAGVRAYAWYIGATGLLAAASPWILRAARGSARAGEMTAVEGRFALLFFLTGALTGAIYWLIAGRGAGKAPS
jgi:hypothetical protein